MRTCYVESVFAFLSVSSVVSSSAARFVPLVDVEFDVDVDGVSVVSAAGLTDASAPFGAVFFLTTIPFIRLFISFLGAFRGIFRVVALIVDVEVVPGKLGAGIDACLAARCLHLIRLRPQSLRVMMM